MRKRMIRSSVLAVAAVSLLLGGTSDTTNVKKQDNKETVAVGKAIENKTVDTADLDKGTVVPEKKEVALQDTETTEVPATATEEETNEQKEESVETASIETKKAKVESNQVVADISSYLNIREEASEDANVVGKFYTGNVGTVVEKGDEWSLVSSGNAYGYVNNDYLLFGDDAEAYIENNCDQVAKVTAETLNVRAEESTDSEVVSLSDQGETLTVLGEENGWVKVAVSDEEVGYVSRDYVYVDYVYDTAITVEEEQAIAEAEAQRIAEEEAAREQAEQEAAQQQEQTEDNSSNYTETPSTEAPSTEAPAKKESESKAPAKKESEPEAPAKEESTSSPSSCTGWDVADYAVQFVGNPYVYGGTSLTNGADCSGFVQSVYKHFGYSLSRTAASQAGDGVSVKLSNIQPGDLLFYHGFGHVAIYIGGGQVVHASNAATGIKISNYDYSPIDKAVRIIR